MEKYRIQEIANHYPSFSPEIVAYGQQILYEVEQDLIAMKFALSRMKDFLEYHEKQEVKPIHFNTIKIGFDDLLKRVSEYSCPHNLKDHLRKKENCPLKDNCKCI
jgi:hypothetical protein